MRTGHVVRHIYLVLLTPATIVWAGPLITDPAALSEFRGTAVFNVNDVLKVQLDYAVFAPGTYPDDGQTGSDPSGGREYVYAYQAYNVSASRTLTVIGMSTTPCQGIRNLKVDPLHAQTGGVVPSFLIDTPPILGVNFLAPQLPAGGYSAVFLFTSPNPPAMSAASVQDGGLAGSAAVPLPAEHPGLAPDLDGDCDVDLDDYALFLDCVSGPAVPQLNAECLRSDFDGDEDVDQSDFGVFQRCFSGTDTLADPGCVS